MKLLTAGKIGCIIPTEEDFDVWKKSGNTDCKTRNELLNRYKTMPSAAIIEISMAEFNSYKIKAKQVMKNQGVPDTPHGNGLRSVVAAICLTDLMEKQK